MEEIPHRVSCQVRNHEVSRGGPTRKSRYVVDEGGDLNVGCSSKHCQSCTAGLIADCVALCCCPCALVNLFTLAFVKVPWMIGRRCLGRVRRKKMKLEIKRKCKNNNEGEGNIVVHRESDCNLMRKGTTEEGIWEMATGFGEEEEMASVSARFEAERLWLELYQIGHFGFGRVSFTGVRYFLELPKSGETISGSPALPNQRKMVVCVGKSSSTSSTAMNSKTSASNNFKSSDTLTFSSNTKQQFMPDCNTSIKKDRSTTKTVTDEEKHKMSRKTVKECPKSTMNSTSIVVHSSKISHTSIPKRTNFDSKDSLLYSSSKASLAQNSGDIIESQQIESASHAQSKAAASGLTLRVENFNQSNGHSSSKAINALSTNPSAPTNSPAVVSDEEVDYHTPTFGFSNCNKCVA